MTSPPSNMLDKLPPELINHILVLACPSPGWPDHLYLDGDPRCLLRNASLVSKRIKERAQTLLWREVVVEMGKEVEVLASLVKGDETKGLMAQTRPPGGSERNELPMLTALALGFPQLKKVQFVRWSELVPTDFTHLAQQSCKPHPFLPFLLFNSHSLHLLANPRPFSTSTSRDSRPWPLSHHPTHPHQRKLANQPFHRP
jgi:hypothetical protein